MKTTQNNQKVANNHFDVNYVETAFAVRKSLKGSEMISVTLNGKEQKIRVPKFAERVEFRAKFLGKLKVVDKVKVNPNLKGKAAVECKVSQKELARPTYEAILDFVFDIAVYSAFKLNYEAISSLARQLMWDHRGTAIFNGLKKFSKDFDFAPCPENNYRKSPMFYLWLDIRDARREYWEQ